MTSINDIVAKALANNPLVNTELLRRAYEFSALEHYGQTRLSGEQYISHPLEVAALVADMRLDDVAIAASLLHDVVEDTLTTIGNVHERFGQEVAHVVEGVTKISTISFSSKEERQAGNFRKMLLAMVDDPRVILVKLADRLHNMRTLGHLDEVNRLKIAQETLDIYVPIAHRLGMRKLKNELEELAFRFLDPSGFERIHTWVEKRRLATERPVSRLKQTLEEKLIEADVPIVSLEGRIKRLFSIREKIKRQKIALDEVYDLIALRVVTLSVRDCYTALGVIHQTWAPVPGRFKDFIAMPRPNGYQSLHTSLVSDRGFPFEVQIRTKEMHQVAEEGIAAHWNYKKGRAGSEPDERYSQWSHQLLESQGEVADASEFIQDLKRDLYLKEVNVFTPKGEVKVLPRGATPLDFAYAVHTDVGHNCVGARVNSRMVPLRECLKNGDIVYVLTSTGHKPSRDWLNYVVTSRARNRIKQFIHSEEKLRAVEFGRKLLDQELARFDFDAKSLLKPDSIGRVLAKFGAQKIDDLWSSIGFGAISSRHVVTALVPTEKLPMEKKKVAIGSVARRVVRPNQETIKAGGSDDLMVFRAGCCNPIRGERIVGYITRGKGVSVHNARCPNVINLLYDPERRIDVVWDTGGKESWFTVCLMIQVQDRKGMLADVTGCIAEKQINIRKVEATANETQRGRIRVTIEISDLKHLQRTVKVVRALPGVLDVERELHEPESTFEA